MSEPPALKAATIGGVASASAAAPDVVVFDFDGTLVTRDSFLDFALGYCLRRPARLLAVGLLLPLAMLLMLRSRVAAGSLLLWAMTVGSSTRAFAQALRSYARSTLPRYAHEAMFAELARHVQTGKRVVIATGSVPLLVRGLLAARQFGRLPIVGSRFQRRCGGLVVETHCTGRTKVQQLARRLRIETWSTVYTDSFADRSLLSGARDITLVCPSNRTLLRTQRMIAGETALRVVSRVS
ncbi:MAG TPA: haloacid dehalogenase-like hydrolase [Polyangiaceae bacterium]